MRSFRYKNILIFSSLQFCGHIEEYFSKHSEKFVAYIIMPRLNKTHNLLRVYTYGKLVKEIRVWSSSNIFLYYASWYIYYLTFLHKYFTSDEEVRVISGHIIAFFGMFFQKLLRNIRFVFWVGDYFPPSNFSLSLYEKVKKHYHDKMQYTCYLGDGINEKLNGKVLNEKNHKTVMWGVKPIKRKERKRKFTILFVGLIKGGQGLESFLDFLKNNTEYHLNIIGISTQELYKQYCSFIQENNIQDRVFFPNKFFSERKLQELSKECHVGIALYDADKTSPTYYTDPGKVKSYTEMGLPVIMTSTSSIVPYIKKFHAGEVIKRDAKSIEKALIRIKQNYKKYKKGVKQFNDYFYYETYYKEKFSFLE